MTATLAPGEVRRPASEADLRRLWAAFTVSEVGTAVGYGAMPIVALLVLHSTAFQVSLLAALSGVASAVLALPLGSVVEFRRKRPTMMCADLVRCAALASVPVAAALGVLTYAQLCVVGVVATTSSIAFNAASGAHLKALVAPERRLAATSRFETTLWTANAVGPPVGGALVSVLGATTSMLVDSASYLLSALGIRRLRTPEPPPPAPGVEHRRRDLTAGWRYIFGHAPLRALFWNSAVFGGCIMLSSPLSSVLMLRDHGLAPWQYGVAMGVPCLGGVIGALCTPRLAARCGERAVLLGSGVLRTVWLAPIALAPHGVAGMLVVTVANSGLLFCAGIFNPSFAAFRLRATDDAYLSRVTTAWSISSKSFQPVFILAGGLLAALAGTRTALLVAAVVLLTSAPLLPWRADDRSQRA